LFDTGPGIEALEEAWPDAISGIAAVFVTHTEGEHVGGLCEVLSRFGLRIAYCPSGAAVKCATPLLEGAQVGFGNLKVTAFDTPGHSSAHNCYLVERNPDGAAADLPLLVSGDLFFAGSVGCAHYCQRRLSIHLRRMLHSVPPGTVIAPGHGPMTTAQNELRYNPFVI
jgi:glyoxylase-like metal-dependent hydrolase (beta-lactamase superfamily II)